MNEQHTNINLEITKDNILQILQQRFGKEVLNYEFPKPYPEHPKNIKAILLGCDPSNNRHIIFPYVFAIKSGINLFNSFVSSLENNLLQINLTVEEVYCQNLCQNYFANETSKNPIWRQSSELWIPVLKKELEQFGSSVPVLLTSELLYTALLNPGLKRIKAKEFYNCSKDAEIPIPSKDNKLERPLIPFYRHFRYQLKREEWKEYRERIIKLVKNSNDK